MTPAQLTTYVRYLTQTDSVTFTDAELLLLANIGIDHFAEEILKVNEDYFEVPATTDLVDDQREYPFPADILSQMKRVEVSFDPDVTPLVFIRLKEIDLSSVKHGLDEASIVANYSNEEGSARFDIGRRAIKILSGTIVAVTGGLKLWYQQYVSHITDLTSAVDMSVDPSDTTSGFPRPFHKLLGVWISIEFKSSKEVPIPLSEREQKFEFDFQTKLNTVREQNLDREVFGDVPRNDGSQY